MEELLSKCTTSELDDIKEIFEVRFDEMWDATQQAEWDATDRAEAECQESHHPAIQSDITTRGVSVQVEDCGLPDGTVMERSQMRILIKATKGGQLRIVGMAGSCCEKLAWLCIDDVEADLAVNPFPQPHFAFVTQVAKSHTIPGTSRFSFLKTKDFETSSSLNLDS